MRRIVYGLIFSLSLLASRPIGLYWKGKTKAILYLDSKVKTGSKNLNANLVIPTDITYDGRDFWVVSRMENKIVALRPDGSFEKVLVEGPSPLLGIAWDRERKCLWGVSSRKIYRLSPNDGTSFASFPSPSRTISALDYGDGYLWALDSKERLLYQIDPETGWLINYFPVEANLPVGLSYEGGKARILDFSGKITVLDINRFFKKKFTKGEGKHWKIILKQGIIAGGGPVEEAVFHFAIPKNRDFQKIIRIKPLFKAEYSTEDEQKIATCKLSNIKPGEAKYCAIEIEAVLYPVHYFLSPSSVKGEIPEKVREIYLRDGEKYDINNPYIKALVKKVLDGETNYYRKVRKIFQFIGERLHYELAGGWNPAPVVLKRGSGSCSEYTFSFISMLRAAGIPARYVGSVVERGTGYDWVFHRWAEVYFPGYGWVPVDAQGGDKPEPLDQARNFGGLSDRFLVTTEAAGPLKSLGWTYNFSHEVKSKSTDYRIVEIAIWERVR